MAFGNTSFYISNNMDFNKNLLRGGDYMTKEIQYPLWKSILWRGLRAGVAGGISNLLLSQFVLKSDFTNGSVYFMALAAAFITGFISAGGLALRDALSEDKNDPAQKLPI